MSLAVGAEQSAPAPFTQEWVEGSQVQLNAPAQQTVAGVTYSFVGWSAGGAATHTVKAPTADTTYTATYAAACSGSSYSSAVLANAPWTYWRLGDKSGTTAADASPNARAGTYGGGVGLVKVGALTGDKNASVSLDGNNDDVYRKGIGGFPTTAVSAELWLKTSDATKEAGIVSYAASSSADELQLRDAPVTAGLREGCEREHRHRPERQQVAPPRGDLEVGRRGGPGVQGRRARLQEPGPGASRHVDHRRRHAGAGPGSGQRGWRVRSDPGLPREDGRVRPLPERAHRGPGEGALRRGDHRADVRGRQAVRAAASNRPRLVPGSEFLPSLPKPSSPVGSVGPVGSVELVSAVTAGAPSLAADHRSVFCPLLGVERGLDPARRASDGHR